MEEATQVDVLSTPFESCPCPLCSKRDQLGTHTVPSADDVAIGLEIQRDHDTSSRHIDTACSGLRRLLKRSH